MKNIIRLDSCFNAPSPSLAPEAHRLHDLRIIQSLAFHAKKQSELVNATLCREIATRERLMAAVCPAGHPYNLPIRQAGVILAFGSVLSRL